MLFRTGLSLAVLFMVGAGGVAPAATPGSAPVAAGPLPVNLEKDLLAAAPDLHPEALRGALSARSRLQAGGALSRPRLAVIDYSLPSTTRRLWVFDLETRRLLFHEWVAHGRNSGGNLATAFSNRDGSLMSSLGAYVTGDTYEGKNGYSLRLRGMDPGRNDNAVARAIVMHGAPYVGEAYAKRVGRLGRSWGCPAVRPEIARALIDAIRDGSLLYVWHPSLTGTATGGAAPSGR